MNTLHINQLSGDELQALCMRPSEKSFGDVSEQVQRDVQTVKLEGDEAVRRLTKEYDGVELEDFFVSRDEIDTALSRIEPEIQEAFTQAAENIRKFHQAQALGRRSIDTMDGVTCFVESRPIEKVGLYIPGGSAPLPSTMLMLGIPAVIAGCKEIVMTTPPNKDGSISDIILFAADLCGIDSIYKIGGAQAVAAMAYGTESIPKVHKVFGPGNQYVTTAKMQVANDPAGAAIDMPAGPSEVFVIADQHARADFVASDLLSQAEHDKSSQTVLVCTSTAKVAEVMTEVEKQLATLPRRDIASAAMANSFALIVDSLDEAVNFSNMFAPEHLILNTRNADDLVDSVNNAGSVFIGEYSCESAGDYASGTNHCLPTYGYAHSHSGVALASFQKQVTFQRVTAEGARLLAPIVTTMAASESLEAHRRAMAIRAE